MMITQPNDERTGNINYLEIQKNIIIKNKHVFFPSSEDY